MRVLFAQAARRGAAATVLWVALGCAVPAYAVGGIPTPTVSISPVPAALPSTAASIVPSPVASALASALPSTPLPGSPGAVPGSPQPVPPTAAPAVAATPAPAPVAGSGGSAGTAPASGGVASAPASGGAQAAGPAATRPATAPPAGGSPPHALPEPSAPLDQVLSALTQERVVTIPAVGALFPIAVGVFLVALFGWRRWHREREAARRLAALERAQSGFLQLASHELRTPLSVLRGYLSMIGDGTIGSAPAELQTVLPIMAAKIDQIDQLIEEMLDVARLEESRIWLARDVIDLRAAAGEAVSLTQSRATARHQIVIEVPTTEVRVEGDRPRLLHILSQLLDNAVKFSPEGGSVAVTVGADGRGAYVHVVDEGIGIAEADLPRLFTRFGRLVTPENSHIFGAGLGLYLARELARMHGGDILVESRRESSRGSTFTLRLPLLRDSEPRQVLSVAPDIVPAAQIPGASPS